MLINRRITKNIIKTIEDEGFTCTIFGKKNPINKATHVINIYGPARLYADASTIDAFIMESEPDGYNSLHLIVVEDNNFILVSDEHLIGKDNEWFMNPENREPYLLNNVLRRLAQQKD